MSTRWPGLHAGKWTIRDSLEERLGGFRKLPVAWFRGSPSASFPRPRAATPPSCWSPSASAPGRTELVCGHRAGRRAREAVSLGRVPQELRFMRPLSSQGDETSVQAVGRSCPAWGRLPGSVRQTAAPRPSGASAHSARSPPHRSDLRMFSGESAVLTCLLKVLKASPWVWTHL